MENKHPASLKILCMTEAGERYGFYTIQSLIALYLSSALGLEDEKIYILVGSFTALTYISPFMGGWIADHFLGQKNAILGGALILLASYLSFAFFHSMSSIMAALAGIAIGTGLLKPNISSLLGHQYENDNPKKNNGFLIFYMGINIGILLGTTLSSQLYLVWGWTLCFISAALGLLATLSVFLAGMSSLRYADEIIKKNKFLERFNFLWAFILLSLFFLLYYKILHNEGWSNLFFTIIVSIAIIYVCRVAYHEKGIQRRKTITFLLLFIISTLFWALYFQMFMSLTLFIMRSVQPIFLGIYFPPPYYIAIQSIGILIFGFILQKYGGKKIVNNKAYYASIKFSIGLFLLFGAYAMITLAISPQSNELISPLIIILAYAVIALAELMLSPVGLAVVTDLVRSEIVSTMMGIFFVSLGLGAYLSGKLANIAIIDRSIRDVLVIKAIYFSAFSKLTLLLFAIVMLSASVIFIVKRLFSNGENSYPLS